MSALQRTILSTVELGVKPVFIVSEHDSSLTYFSLLLSNHLLPKGEAYRERALMPHDNYFNTPYLNHLIQHDYQKFKSSELESILSLHLEEGFDTKRLYGIALSIEFYQKLRNSELLSNRTVIFIYSDFKSKLEKDRFFESSALVGQLESEKSILFLNNKLAYSYPNELIDELRQYLNAKAFNVEKIKPLDFNASDCTSYEPFYNDICKARDITSSKFLSTSSLSFIISLDKEVDMLTLSEYLSSIILTRSEKTNIILLCDNVIKFQKELPEVFANKLSIQVLASNQNLSFQLNALIKNIQAEWIIIDNLYLKPEAKIWNKLAGLSQTIYFGKLGIKKEEAEIQLSDLLTKEIPEFNICFKRSHFEEIGGFDEFIKNEKTFWDLALRLVNTKQSTAWTYSTELVISKKQEPESEDDSSNQYIIQKHEALLQHCLNDVLLSINKDIGLTQSELKVLHYKVSSLSLLLSHSKDELKSMQSLNAELHHRIQYLENNWYQKIIQKTRRIKKIFFKKKSPGTGTLKRIWTAFRFLLSKSGVGILRKVLANFLKHLYLLIEKRPVEIVYQDQKKSEGIYNYHNWILNKLDKEKLDDAYSEEVETNHAEPLISIVMPVYNPPLRYLKEAIESVVNQNYPKWQLCIADDNSPNEKVRKLLRAYAVKDQRIQVVFRPENGHISATSNSALEIAKGEYVLFMDHDDLLTQHCLWEIVKAINANASPDIIYSDEDKIDENRFHQSAYFKPDWSPDHLLASNYIGHVCVIKKSLIEKIHGFRLGYEGSQDYDLLLRATERTDKIVHVPKVLYHWRIHQLSAAAGEDVKPYAYIAAKKALEDTLDRRGLSGKVRYLSGLRGYRIDFKVHKVDKVSVIIPTKDQTELLKNAVDSILAKTSYSNYEILILNNNSTTKELGDFLNEYTSKYPNKIKSLDAHFNFNFSKLMNIGVKETAGEYILFLNNDIEVIEPDWLTHMVSFAQQKHVGAVGARLLYPDDTIQHAGVIVGLGGIAGHAFAGLYKEDPGYFNLIQTVNNFSAVTAACLLCRREVFEDVNGMDEQFEVEYNDVDFCLKIMEAGYYNVYVPQVELYHYESATRGHPHQSKPSYERHLREMALFKSKWQHIIDRDPYYNPNLHLGVHDFTMDLNV